jgi:hypothetical protein
MFAMSCAYFGFVYGSAVYVYLDRPRNSVISAEVVGLISISKIQPPSQ